MVLVFLAMEDSGPSGKPTFPQQLSDVPPAHRLSQTYGIGPSLWGLAFIGWLMIGFFQPAPLTRNEKLMMAASGAVGAALIAWDVLRRRKRIVLWVTPQEVGIYRKRTLDLVVPTGVVTQFVLSASNTFRGIFPFMIGAIMGIGGSFAAKRPVDRAMALSAGCFAAIVCASMAWTRIMSLHFYVPRSTGAMTDRAIFSRRHPATAVLANPRQALLFAGAAEVRRKRAERRGALPPDAAAK